MKKSRQQKQIKKFLKAESMAAKASENPAKATVSVCMIVKNEEGNLPRCLSSIKDFADEIIIVDTGSSDRTVDIAEEYGAKVHHFEWCDDFSAARNESLKHASKDFILWLDADDEFKKEEQDKLLADLNVTAQCIMLRNQCAQMKNILKKQDAEDTVAYAIRMVLHDKHSNAYVEQYRVFENRAEFYFINPVHEQLTNDGAMRTIASSAVIIHHGYDTSENIIQKNRRNFEILEKVLADHPDDFIALCRASQCLFNNAESMEKIAPYYERIETIAQNSPAILEKSNLFKNIVLEKAELLKRCLGVGEAVDYLESCKTILPDFFKLSYALGQYHFYGGNFERAFAELYPWKEKNLPGAGLVLHKDAIPRHLPELIGLSAFNTGRYDEARQCFEELMSKYPDDESFCQYLARTYERLSNVPKAINVCEKGLATLQNSAVLRELKIRLERLANE